MQKCALLISMLVSESDTGENNVKRGGSEGEGYLRVFIVFLSWISFAAGVA